MSLQEFQAVTAIVAEEIRRVIDEDWLAEFDIGPDTRFKEDLELESIEFVAIARAIILRFGARADLLGWLSGKTISELIGLSVGDVARHLVACSAVR